jgi:methionyl-tRNA formyltransferase
MRLVFFGFGKFAVPCLISLLESEHEIAGVVELGGTGQITSHDQPSAGPVWHVAQGFGLPRIYLDDLGSVDSVKRLKAVEADLGIVIAFGWHLPGALRGAFTFGCIGIHASLLPKYRGPAPITWAILKGETKTGVSVFRITDNLDSGPVLVQRETMIIPGETWAELDFRLARVACDSLNASLAMLKENPAMEGILQNESEATWAPRPKEETASEVANSETV